MLFLAAAGSGQADDDGGYGAEMFALSMQLSETMPIGTTYESEPLDYPAAGIGTLIADKVSIPTGHAFSDSVIAGDTAMAVRLTRLRQNCPAEKVILAGYSQGALIVHDTIEALDGSDYWQRHIAGVSLIADPRRFGPDPVNRGAASSQGFGLTALGMDGIKTPAPIPAWFAGVTRSYCAAKDLVCAATTSDLLNPKLLHNEVNLHTHYGTATMPNLFSAEADRLERLVDRSQEWVPNDAPVTLPAVAAGYPVNANLAAQYPWREGFGVADTLPAGLTLTPAGLLRSAALPVGSYDVLVDVVSRFGDVSLVHFVLPVVDPSTVDVPLDPDPITVDTLQLHQKVALTLPGVPAKSLVAVEAGGGPVPAGLTISAAGRLSGTPKVAGTFTLVLRIAQPDRVRRALLELTISNPARLVSVTSAGVRADSDVRSGIVLDADRVAFVSEATNLGAATDGTSSVFIKDLATGALAHWTPPANEFNPELVAGQDKSVLYIVTLAVDPDSGDTASIVRRLPVAGVSFADGSELNALDYARLIGADPHSWSYAVSPYFGLLVSSDSRLDHPEQPSDGTRRVYQVGPVSVVGFREPQSEGIYDWSFDALVSVRSDGAVLAEASTYVNSDRGVTKVNGLFLLRTDGRWIAVDRAADGHRIPMAAAVLYAGGVVYAADPPVAPAAQGSVQPHLIVITPKVNYFKSIGGADPVLFGPSSATGGIVPLSASSYADGSRCATFNRSDADRNAVTTDVTAGREPFHSCVADVMNATPTPVSTDTQMLVFGFSLSALGEPRQLLLAQIP